MSRPMALLVCESRRWRCEPVNADVVGETNEVNALANLFQPALQPNSGALHVRPTVLSGAQS